MRSPPPSLFHALRSRWSFKTAGRRAMADQAGTAGVAAARPLSARLSAEEWEALMQIWSTPQDPVPAADPLSRAA